MTIAFFDLDGTLTGGPSSERLFLMELARHGLLGPRQLVAALAFQRRYGRAFGRHALKKNKAYLAGLPVDDVAQIGRRFVRDVLAARLRPDVLSRLCAHQAAGEAAILLTGAPDFIARPLAAALGMEDCIASRCAAVQGLFVAEPPPLHPFGPEKRRLAQLCCGERGVAPESCAAYGDSVYDLPLLESVGRAVAVYPDSALRLVARRRGWPIIDGSRLPLEAASPA